MGPRGPPGPPVRMEWVTLLFPYPHFARDGPANLAFEVHSVGYASEVAVCFCFPKSQWTRESRCVKIVFLFNQVILKRLEKTPN